MLPTRPGTALLPFTALSFASLVCSLVCPQIICITKPTYYPSYLVLLHWRSSRAFASILANYLIQSASDLLTFPPPSPGLTLREAGEERGRGRGRGRARALANYLSCLALVA